MHARSALARIEELIVQNAPSYVTAMKIREPVFCLRIWYFGGDCLPGERAPMLMLPTDSLRQSILKQHGKQAPHYLWCADEFDLGSVDRTQLDVPELVSLCDQWIDELENAHSLPAGPGGMTPLRETVQRAAKRLNKLDWSAFAPVTPDFVVFAADGTHDFCDDIGEMQASVSAEHISDFRARGLLK